MEARLAGDESRGDGSVRLASAAGRWVLAVAVLGDAMILLEATVVNVSLPAIGRDLGAGVAGLQWTLNGYVLTLAALVLVCGSLSDTYGRRRIFILGTAVFVAASALCAAAPTIGLLVGARFVQGIGGALLTPGSLAIIEAVFHPDDRTRAIGAWAGLGAVAGAIGPSVGGYLTDAVSWRAVFLINIPVGIFVVVAAMVHVPETRDPTRAGGVDLRGAALATLAIAGLCFALIEASGGLTPAVITAAAVAAVAAAAFVAVERRARNPMLPLELFRSRQFASANLLGLVTYAALGGVIFLFVAFLQVSLGYSALQAGAATLPVTVLLLALSTPSGAIAQRIGPRIPLTTGTVLVGAGLLLMTRIHPGDRFILGVLPALIVFGAGLGVVITPITATVLASVDSRHSGIASAVNNELSRLGQMIAVAALPLAAGLSGSAFEDPAAMAAGFPVAMAIAAGVSFAAALLAWTTISSDVLSRSGTSAPDVPEELPPSLKRHCPVAGTPLSGGSVSGSAARQAGSQLGDL
jgi:EmrB/QacA subfamily drug resistance transporter